MFHHCSTRNGYKHCINCMNHPQVAVYCLLVYPMIWAGAKWSLMVVDGRWFDSVKAFCQTFDENSGNQFFVSATWLIFAFIARWHGRTWVWVKNGRGQEWSKMNVWMVKICENHDKPWGFMRLRFRNFETTFFPWKLRQWGAFCKPTNRLGNQGACVDVGGHRGIPTGESYRCACGPSTGAISRLFDCLTYQSGIIWVTF